jgi:hypothetical protein
MVFSGIVTVSARVPVVTFKTLHLYVPLVVLAAQSRWSASDVFLLFVPMLRARVGNLRTVRWVGVPGAQAVRVVGVDVGGG